MDIVVRTLFGIFPDLWTFELTVVASSGRYRMSNFRFAMRTEHFRHAHSSSGASDVWTEEFANFEIRQIAVVIRWKMAVTKFAIYFSF